MTPEQLREQQAPVKAQYQENPESALVPMSVTGELDRETLSCRLPERETSISSLHPAAGGQIPSLCSGEILLESLAACAGVTFCSVATAMGIDFEAGTVTAKGDLDFRGTLGVSRSTPVGMQNLSIAFSIRSDAEEASLKKLLQLTERYCVIYQTLSQENPIQSSLDLKS
ncbi:MAG: OsmC family protein [Planctomycetaceae bacterium]|nr:OsmC family protein [Planctomycetaceae bacterium]